MKKNNVKKGIFTALLLASPFVTAGTQYPASDFQPKVVYQDKDYQHESSSNSAGSNVSGSEKAAPDSNYPAATFQPEVVYIDKSYKHNAKVETRKTASVAKSVASTNKEVAAIEQAEVAVSGGQESSMNPLFAVLVLSVAAFLYFKKSKGTSPTKPAVRRRASSAPAAPRVADASGLTGVAKYLQQKSPKLSGVAKYIEANQASPKSGVAKYVARKVVAAKQAASEKTTGVEKYLRNRG